jgi:bifunctional non-homologous end joining protein LigD
VSNQWLVVDGHRIAVTNLDKVLYAATGTTKAAVIAYYTEVAPALLPHLCQRPITRKRYPAGIDTDGEAPGVFFAKNLPVGTPEWIRRYCVQHAKHSLDYPVADDAATVAWLAQLAALELHVPQWRFAEDGTPLPPDRLVLDLDPGEGVSLAACAEVADWAREILDGAGLTAFPVTSGSKGIHLYAHLNGSIDAADASALAKELAEALQARHPDRVTAVMRRSDRAGKVFLDWSQNNPNKTTVSPYSLRGRVRPWVAAPRTWAELGTADVAQLEFDEVLARLAQTGDLLAPLLPASDGDRLARYRGMRDATRTPEPVPAEAPTTSTGDSFVIQEHHARRLHWDFRLERNGVLVSWAVPKGPPSDPASNHLAVHVEDHPLAYGGFEGTIPKGEYGAGTVTIWDAGHYELEKWRDGAEVILTLHGRPDGGLGGRPARFALIHTGEQNWLIHRMQPAPTPAVERSSRVDPAAFRPMLATAATAEALGDGSEWAFELKWDGIRAIITIEHGRAHLTGRNGRDETARYPELLPDVIALGFRSAIMDGEIVALGRAGAPDFGRLQDRLNLTKPAEIAAAATASPVQLMVFDLLELDGLSLLELTYQQRRALLEQVAPPAGSRIQVPPAFDGDVNAALAASEQFGLEGVVAKRRTSKYLPGRRSPAWVKIKHRRTHSVVIGGWTSGSGNRAGSIGSLLVGIPAGDRLHYRGRVGSGFTDAGLRQAEALLQPLASDESPFANLAEADAPGVHWVRPQLVGEVQFAALTARGQFRHPVWLGWRPELTAADVRVE